MLFDRDNRALAVTTLLNTPQKFDDIFSLSSSGKIDAIASGDITQDIVFVPDIDVGGRLVIHIYNQALATSVGTVYYNLSDDTQIDVAVEP